MTFAKVFASHTGHDFHISVDIWHPRNTRKPVRCCQVWQIIKTSGLGAKTCAGALHAGLKSLSQAVLFYKEVMQHPEQALLQVHCRNNRIGWWLLPGYEHNWLTDYEPHKSTLVYRNLMGPGVSIWIIRILSYPEFIKAYTLIHTLRHNYDIQHEPNIHPLLTAVKSPPCISFSSSEAGKHFASWDKGLCNNWQLCDVFRGIAQGAGMTPRLLPCQRREL